MKTKEIPIGDNKDYTFQKSRTFEKLYKYGPIIHPLHCNVSVSDEEVIENFGLLRENKRYFAEHNEKK